MKMDRSNEIKFVLNTLCGPFPLVPRRDCKIENMDWEFLLAYAKGNNLLFHVARHALNEHGKDIEGAALLRIEEIVSSGEKKIKDIQAGTRFLQNDFPQDFVLHKTFRNYDRIPNDLDFLVSDFPGAMKTLDGLLGPSPDIDYDEDKAVYYSKEKFKLHLHGRCSWVAVDYMDYADILSDPRLEIFNGVEVTIPNVTMDFLIHVAHMNYEPMHFTLSELVYLHSIHQGADKDYCRAQARKYHWERAYVRTLKVLDQFYEYFFDPANSLDVVDSEYLMPKTFSRFHIIAAFLERGLIMEPLKKLPKALKVLVSGNSYGGYYTAPEEKISGAGK